ncbi:hypothetical protein ACX0G9_28875 [Flavitalea flava]
MKKSLTSPISKLIPVIFFLSFMFSAKAQSSEKVQAAALTQPTGTEITDSSKTEGPFAIKYLGTEGDLLAFQVVYENPEGQKFSIMVKDQEGAQLYHGIFTEKTFFKQFRLPRTDKNKISFIIRNYRSADISKAFVINVNSRFVEEVAIKKTN